MRGCAAIYPPCTLTLVHMHAHASQSLSPAHTCMVPAPSWDHARRACSVACDLPDPSASTPPPPTPSCAPLFRGSTNLGGGLFVADIAATLSPCGGSPNVALSVDVSAPVSLDWTHTWSLDQVPTKCSAPQVQCTHTSAVSHTSAGIARSHSSVPLITSRPQCPYARPVVDTPKGGPKGTGVPGPLTTTGPAMFTRCPRGHSLLKCSPTGTRPALHTHGGQPLSACPDIALCARCDSTDGRDPHSRCQRERGRLRRGPVRGCWHLRQPEVCVRPCAVLNCVCLCVGRC